MEDLPGVNRTSVWYGNELLPQDKLGKFCPGRSLYIRFEYNPGDLALVEIDSANVTGHGVTVVPSEVKSVLCEQASELV